MATTLERVTELGVARANAYTAARDARTALREAIAIALGAGADPADIVAAITGPRASTSRAGAYKIIAEVQDHAAAAWESAGSPARDQALTGLDTAEQATRDALTVLGQANNSLIQQFEVALRGSAAPSVLVAESGLTQQTGYRYLQLARDYRAVRDALEDMLNVDDSRRDALPQAEISVSGTGLRVRNCGELDHRDEEQYGRIESLLAQRLAAAGYAMTAPSTGRWTTVKKTEEN
jgi:hypothetical protein